MGDTPRINPHVDLAMFGGAHHRHITVRAVPDGQLVGQVGGWRLWCMACGLTGERVYQDVDQARSVAASLRSDAEPPCMHRTTVINGDDEGPTAA